MKSTYKKGARNSANKIHEAPKKPSVTKLELSSIRGGKNTIPAMKICRMTGITSVFTMRKNRLMGIGSRVVST